MSAATSTPGASGDRRQRIAAELRVASGSEANLGRARHSWTGGGEYDELSGPRARRPRPKVARRGDRAPEGRAGAALGERHLRAPRRLPGDGRRRQGLDHRARHVRREPAGRPRLLVQAAVERRARPHVPLADRQGASRSEDASGSSTAPTTKKSSRRRVHPEWLDKQKLPPGERGAGVLGRPLRRPRAFERHLDRNGTKIVKFFLHVSKAEQKRRFLARLDNPDKQWKFSADDVADAPRLGRVHAGLRRGDQRDVDRPGRPGTRIPADDKRVMQAMVATILVDTIGDLDLQWPTVSEDERVGTRKPAGSWKPSQNDRTARAMPWRTRTTMEE